MNPILPTLRAEVNFPESLCRIREDFINAEKEAAALSNLRTSTREIFT